MNWKLIFQLSVFGFIMAWGTIQLIPESIEPFFWVLIFAFCAWVIAKACGGRYFLHGFLVSMVNCIWITGVHIIFRTTYLAHHPRTASAFTNMPASWQSHPRLSMLIMGPLFGVGFGIILGLFCFIASKIVKKNVTA